MHWLAISICVIAVLVVAFFIWYVWPELSDAIRDRINMSKNRRNGSNG